MQCTRSAKSCVFTWQVSRRGRVIAVEEGSKGSGFIDSMIGLALEKSRWDLIEQFPLRPILSERATGIANQLAVQAKTHAGRGRAVRLIEKYEDKHHAIPPVSF